MEVRPERTEWRDLDLSKRHRLWEFDCPAVDVDFLLVEYDKGKCVALVEYKHQAAAKANPKHPSYKALIDLANRAGVPLFVCRYSPDFTSWIVTAYNLHARGKLGEDWKIMTELEWVSFLYKLRYRELPSSLLFDDTGKLILSKS